MTFEGETFEIISEGIHNEIIQKNRTPKFNNKIILNEIKIGTSDT
tara:strand:+ start:1240 stop:1374 length:135 start_codon:yes stop_codon:yes gene_type:complete